MVERWTSADVRELLRNKYVVIIGDSIQRGVYKDLVYILQSNGYIDDRHLRAKGEKSCLGDELIEGGRFGEMHNGKNYREVRHYKCPSNYYMVTFYMVTACYSAYMETILRDLWNDPRPDIVIMNSCVWDITRYGPMSSVRYRENLQRLAKRMKTVLPDDCLFLWLTTTPLGKNVKGGFLLDQISFLSEVLRLDVLESNYYARQVMVDYEFDVLDMHFHFVKWINLRKADGIHWNPKAHRKMSNLIFDHLADAFGFPIPRIPHWGSANGEGVFMIPKVRLPPKPALPKGMPLKTALPKGKPPTPALPKRKPPTPALPKRKPPKPAMPKLKCHHCGKGFESAKPMYIHIRIEHPEEFKCVCGMKFKEESHLAGHMQIKCPCGFRSCLKTAKSHAKQCSLSGEAKLEYLVKEGGEPKKKKRRLNKIPSKCTCLQEGQGLVRSGPRQCTCGHGGDKKEINERYWACPSLVARKSTANSGGSRDCKSLFPKNAHRGRHQRNMTL